jgi:flagellar biosynthetic protein FliP
MPTSVRGPALRGTLVLLTLVTLLLAASTAAASPAQAAGSSMSVIDIPRATTAPTQPTAPEGTTPGVTQPAGPGSVTLDLDGGDEPSKAVVAILLLTVLSLAPALLLLMTSFTRIVIVLSLTRNALGVQAIPPNQVIVGLALFLSLFVMGPTLDKVNEEGIQPLLNNEKTPSQAYEDGIQPLRDFMMKEVKEKELALFVKAADDDRPARPEDVSLRALVPAFVLSEIKTAFIIGFVIFIPFLVIDIVVSSSLMSMGMMMLPPVLISLPFKLLLFVMVDGWALVVQSLLASYA